MVGRVKQLGFAFLAFAFASGCNSQVEPPAFENNVFKTINYDQCKGASFKFKKQTPQSLRALVSCVNGSDKVIQPYVDFVNSVSDDDLKVYIESFDEHFSPYLNQALDLMNRMQERGLLREFSKNMSVLIENGLFATGIELWQKTYDENGQLSPTALDLHEFIAELVSRDRLRGGLKGSAGLLDNPNAWAVAELLSRSGALKSPQIAEILERVINNMTKAGSLNATLILASDRRLYEGLRSTSPQDVSAMAKTFDLLMKDDSPNGSLVAIQKLHVALAKEYVCFNGPKGSRQTLRLDEINAREQIRRKGNKNSLDRLMLVETPFLLAGSVRDCNIPATVIENYPLVFPLVEGGASPGMAAINAWFYPAGRLNYMARAMASGSLLDTAKVEQLFAAKNASAYLLPAMQSLSPADFGEMSSLLTEFAVEDLGGPAISSWIRNKFPKALQGEALGVLKDLKNPHFHDFIDLMSLRYPQYEGVLREVLADTNFSRRRSDSVTSFLRKIFSTELRPQLLAFMDSLANSWSDTRGGVGPMLSVLAESGYLAEENPFQFWMRSMFSDRDFQRKWFPVTSRLIKTSEFKNALGFTAKFAQSPQFDGFLKFMIDIFRYSDQKGLLTDPIAGGYVGPKNKNYAAKPSVPAPNDTPPNFAYPSCREIKGGLWDKGGEVFYDALKCLGGDRPTNGLSKLAELLKQSGDLSDLTDLLSRNVFNTENAHYYLNDLKMWQKDGDLAAFMELLIKSRRIGPDVIPRVESIIADYLSQRSATYAMESLGPVMKSQYLGNVAHTLLDTWERTDDKSFFKSDSSFVMPIANADELLKEAAARVPQVDINQARHELKNFVNRGPNYFYDQGLYKNESEAVIQADIYRMLILLLRTDREAKTGDLEEFLKALQDIFEWHRQGKVNVAEFARWGSSAVKAIPYYVGGEEQPRVRFVVPFDQLDILVANADFPVAGSLPVVGVDHLGTLFQIKVAESKNLGETIHDLKKMMSRVINWGKPFIEREKYNHLLNDLESFTVLEDAVKRGHLVILQRLYQAFYNSTKPGDRRKQDVNKNHMSLVHQPTRWAMFSRLVAPLRHVDTEGQLDHLIGVLAQLVKSLSPGDERAVRAAVDNLMTRRSNTFSGMDHVLTLLFESSKDAPVFDQMKDQIYHSIFALGRNLGRGRVFFEVLSGLNADMVGRSVDRYYGRLSKRDSADLNFISRWASLDADTSKLIRAWTVEVSTLTPRGLTALGEVLTPLVQVVNTQDSIMIDTLDKADAILRHPEVKAKNVKVSLRRILNEYQTLKIIFPQILANAHDRQMVGEILLKMAQQQEFQGLSDALIEIYESGQFDDLLTLVNDYSAYRKN